MTALPKHTASFFANRDCPHFPCHDGVDPNEFNCLFCYCPLYALGPDCEGDFSYTEAGVKDCSACTVMHRGDAGAKRVKEKFKLLSELASKPSK